jgi:hypothetical protein
MVAVDQPGRRATSLTAPRARKNPLPTSSPDELARYVSDQLAHWAHVVRTTGVQPQ